jgi:hypothetical protein
MFRGCPPILNFNICIASKIYFADTHFWRKNFHRTGFCFEFKIHELTISRETSKIMAGKDA